MKSENTLLKQLVIELQEKNELLKEKLQGSLTDNKRKMPLYSEVASLVKQQQKRIPKITVKKIKNDKNNSKNIDIRTSVLNCLTAQKNIQTKSFVVNRNEDIVISCPNQESAEITETILKEKLEGICLVKKEELINPKVKIVGIDNYTNMSKEEIESDINNRNFNGFENKGHVLHMYKNNSNNKSTVLMEVTADLYKHILDNKKKVFVGYQNCRTFDLINIRPCGNCGRFGHSEKNCTNVSACLNCSEAHKTSECSNNMKKCLNCSFSNNNYKTSYDVNHLAYDHNLCSILRKKIDRYIDSADYPVRPTLPTRVTPYQQKRIYKTSDSKDGSLKAGDTIQTTPNIEIEIDQEQGNNKKQQQQQPPLLPPTASAATQRQQLKNKAQLPPAHTKDPRLRSAKV